MVLVLVNDTDNNPDLGKLRFHLKLQRRHVILLESFSHEEKQEN